MSSKRPAPLSLSAPSLFWSLVGVNMMVFMATLDMSIVNVALPSLAKQLHTNFATVQWVILSYVLAIASLLLIFSRIGDMRCKKGIFSLGLGIFTLGSLFCGLSPGVEWLIGSRALQGIGGAMSQALGIAIVTEIVPSHRRGRAIGIVGGTAAMGLALGPSMGGLIIEFIGWRWIFLINLPIGLLAYWIIARHMPSLPPTGTAQSFDIPGAILAAVTLAAYSIGMTMGQKLGFDSAITLGLLGSASVGLLAFILVEKRVSQPMIDLELFVNPLISLNLLTAVLVFIALSGGFIMPFFLQLAQHRPPSQVGLLIMLIPLSMGLSAPLSGALSDRFSTRGLSLLGLVVVGCGCLAISTLTLETPWWGFALRVAPLGFGVGLFQSPNSSAIMGAVHRQRLGVASGLINYARVFGQTTGLPLVGVIFTLFVTSVTMEPARGDLGAIPPEALLAGITGAYLVQALFILVAIGLSITAWILDHLKRMRM